MTDRPEQDRAQPRAMSKGHNLDVIKTADWVIDLGPGGGVNGGEVVVAGTPEAVAAEAKSFTGQYLRPLLERSSVRPERSASAVEGRQPRRRKAVEDVAAE